MILSVSMLFAGCGYTLRSAQNLQYKTIFIPVFTNRISIQDSYSGYSLYYQGLEVDLDSILKNRFRYDGNVLPVSNRTDADIALIGAVLSYDKNALSYASNEDVNEYRVIVRSEVCLVKNGNELWKEVLEGETSYLTTGPNAKSEAQALRTALEDLSRKIVDRVVSDW